MCPSMPRRPTSRLSRCVVALAGIARRSDHRGNTDDPAKTLLHHGPHHQATHAENGFEIGVEDRVPVVVLHAHRQGVPGDAGIVHEHLQTAVFPENTFHQDIRFGSVVDIQLFTRTARKSGKALADFCRALLAGGRTDHFQTLLSQ